VSTAPRTVRDRLATWYFTGPVGHFVAGLLDLTGLLGRLAWARVRSAASARAR